MTIGVKPRTRFLASSAALCFCLSAAHAQTHLVGKLLYGFDPASPNGTNLSGDYPNGALAQDAQGRLYGTTSYGGLYGQGTIFRLTRPASGNGLWTEEVLFNFQDNDTGVRNGESPSYGVVIDQAGIVYGIAEKGGEHGGHGLVFSFDPSTGVYKILHEFIQNTRDGVEPRTGLAFGPGGLLYGTTTKGGFNDNGVVFSISPLGDQTEYAIIHYFRGNNPADGDYPVSSLISGGPSRLLGTTFAGGSAQEGTVYSLKLDTKGKWVETVLHNFQDTSTDFTLPSNVGDFVLGPQGVLYGTASGGGLDSQGGIYQLTPPATAGGAWQEIILHTNNPGKNDFVGQTTLALEPSGQLVGTGAQGGSTQQGGIFQMTPPATAGANWTYQKLYVFGTPPYGETPSGPLIRQGKFYAGVTAYSAGSGTGTAFKLKTIP